MTACATAVPSPRRLTRIALVGAESTGKSTLARTLGGEFGAVVTAEYARVYAADVKRALTSEDVPRIAEGQIRIEDAATKEACARGVSLVLLDTDLVSTFVYASIYFGDDVAAGLRELLPARLADLYLLCQIDLPFVRDPVRDEAVDRSRVERAFATALMALAADVTGISGEGALRTERGRDAVRRVRLA